MNIRISGKFPEKPKRIIALFSVLTVILCSGCDNSQSGTDSVISSQLISSDDRSTHIPVEESSNSAESSSFSQSSDKYDSLLQSDSESEEVSDSSDNSESEIISQSIYSEKSSLVSEPVSCVSKNSISESEPPYVVSSEPVSSVVSEPPAPVVVVPDVAMPMSPGISCAVSQYGVIDYSDASKGYISARYTGSSGKVKLRIESGGQKCDHDLSVNQTTEYFPLSFGSSDYTVTIYENISGTKYANVLSVQFNADIANALSPFLYPNKYTDYSSSSDCVYKAAELCAGLSSTIDKIAAVFCWITDNVSYDYELAATVQTGYVPNPDRTYNSHKGICFDYASLMCAMLRSQSIPTRLVVGYASPDIYHAWNEVYTEETGWIT
ncbi:MAG: transglutaminase-like domain-containing protein, partial [Oscillospiraceae bacterium]|nr:transglutaminase-like domain-containing protein [Oscillospiraceae bacterium]